LDDEGALRAGGGAVEGAGDELLARAGLAADEHGEIRGRDLLEHGEDLAHPHALADEIVEALAPAHLDLDVARRALEAQHALADLDLGAGAEPDLAHPQIADERAVGRLEVAEQEALL